MRKRIRRNGMCPICYLKRVFTKQQKVTNITSNDLFDNKVANTPPMGWSSWNTFRNKINQDLIYEIALVMKESGLLEAGYEYLNLDDNWHSSMRDESGLLQGDLVTFSRGIPDLVQKINALGIKMGIYSSNGVYTCEELPGSLYHEKEDALTFARWGIEYFKYDFCHNKPISTYAPLVFSIDIANADGSYKKEFPCTDAKLDGLAKFMPDKQLPTKMHVSGLDANCGTMTYTNINCPEDGEYILTINIKKHNKYDSKFLVARINDQVNYEYNIPDQQKWSVTARFQKVVVLKKGNNKVLLVNPISNRADSAMWQYTYMSNCLKQATKAVSLESQNIEKPIVFSVCEWGKNQPEKWAMTCSNLWRTTPDIWPRWNSIMNIYESNINHYLASSAGHWNDPDMLEVGNGNLTYDENLSHFSLWCMMAAPLILGNDLRSMNKNVLDIVTNKNLIAIDQDALGKSAKRIKRSKLDILARPLADGSVALMFFNRAKKEQLVNFDLHELYKDEYLNFSRQNNYTAVDMWMNEFVSNASSISTNLASHACKVYKVK